ncbi:MAG: hypothetical protein Aureis2KO_19740 [Aureisphaera sp.]
MKKTFLALLFMGFTAVSMGQESDNDTRSSSDPKHEFRLDALEGLIVPAVDISYEYIISKYSGAGISAFIGLEDDADDYQSWAITPYYRQYFFNKQDYGARGFFAEGVLQAGGGSDLQYLFDEDVNVEEDWTKFGIGFAIGQKWVSRNGFVVELSVGGGRYFGGDDVGPEGFFRGGASVGYRF